MKAVGALSVTINTFFIGVMVVTPLLGVWLATALVSFHGGPRGLALAAGFLLFPILPAAWEAYALHRWRKAGSKKKQFLTKIDRLLFRTLAINGVFLFALLSSYPKTAFAALATQGDWFIAERQTPWATRVRGSLVSAAQGLEWLHRLANPNPYRKETDEKPVPESVRPNDRKPPKDPPTPRPDPTPSGELEPKLPPSPVAERGHWAVGETFWPFRNTVHPVVQALAPAEEASLDALAKTIAEREPDPFLRVKALHDWAVTRLRYDVASTRGERAPQDAASVFANRRGVCEGYARLLVELGRLTGDRIEYVTGEVREESGELAPLGHAWNAVEIRGAWYLIDATWDDPVSSEREVYKTTYLFIPPALAGLDHFPDQADWQLRGEPLRRTEFLRQPLARPSLAREGLAIVEPRHQTIEVDHRLEIVLDNPLRRFVMLTLDGEQCEVDDAGRLTLACAVPPRDRLKARLFVNTTRHGTYESVAALDVTRR